MNRNNLKKYAPEARRDFIRAVTDRASYYGLTAKKTEPVTIQGDVAIISGRAFPKKLADQRKRLEDRIKRQGFDQVMEAMAYTWFNRLVAIRFMELHGYLDHGYRVLSHPEGGATPEIVEHAEHVDLPGLDKQKIVSLKLEGTKEAELYRMLLIAQCNALHSAMPFLFERIDDETELLLPDNLLHSDSLIRTLVSEIPEEDWQEVEIIGWLYQFYISEKKDEVIGKVVKSEDIPAATQLFTPNWIVKYLVQNSLGRQWMATYPNSPLKAQMEYYIEPAEQTPEVQEQLKAITPDSLNPEELTLLDPACGSGHILVEAYDLLKAIYQERGYRAKDIPRLILENNLYGLEIDDRAAQLAAFALMMKARADDRRIFDSGIQPHVLAIQESKGLDAKEITEALNAPLGGNGAKGDISQADVAHLIDLFEHGKTFGSLIEVPEKLAERLPVIDQRVKEVVAHGGMFEQAATRFFKVISSQAAILSTPYDAVVANPPYLSGMFGRLLQFANDHYPRSKSDLYAMFLERGLAFTYPHGVLAMITMHGWMFLSSFEVLRRHLLRNTSIRSMWHLGPRAFPEISGEVVQTAATCFTTPAIPDYKATYVRTVDGEWQAKQSTFLSSVNRFVVSQDNFTVIPASPMAYWISDAIRRAYSRSTIGDTFDVREGCGTRNDERFLRRHWEVSASRIRNESGGDEKWVKTDKAGGPWKWYGHHTFVMNWENDGYEIRNYRNPDGSLKSRPQNIQFFFMPAVSWGKVGTARASFRFREDSFAFNDAAPSLFEGPLHSAIALCNSRVFDSLLELQGGTMNLTVGIVAGLPFLLPDDVSEIERNAKKCIAIAKSQWATHEECLEFRGHPLLESEPQRATIDRAYREWSIRCKYAISETQRCETRNNEILLGCYGLSEEQVAFVDDLEITLYRPNREEDIQRLISYAIGCMMGRYSLDKPGLIYAHSGGEGFWEIYHEKHERLERDKNGHFSCDSCLSWSSFPPDPDGIIPITEFEWFEDDAANRLEEFIGTAWPKDHLEENLKFIAESIGQKKSESARDAIRRYLAASGAGGFYKHHLSLYKKRPIYWLFSSGKQRAFQCLVYLHRYNAGTLSRMRTEYVIPLSGKMASRIDQLEGDIAAASSTSHRKKLEKERQTLVKQREELQAFDELLRHYADQRITLDLDDGVKVNYSKFGSLLAEVKAVTGSKAED
jgi:hypothetical protein